MPHIPPICFKDLVKSITVEHDKIIDENKRLRYQLALFHAPKAKIGEPLSGVAFVSDGPIGDYSHLGFTPEGSPRGSPPNMNGVSPAYSTPQSKEPQQASSTPRYDLKIAEQDLQAIVDEVIEAGVENKMPAIHENPRKQPERVSGRKSADSTDKGKATDHHSAFDFRSSGETCSSKRKESLLGDLSDIRRHELEKKVEKMSKSKGTEVPKTNMFSFVHSEAFGIVSAILILCNSVYIGIQTNAQVQFEIDTITGVTHSKATNWLIGEVLVGDLVFCVWFLVELCLRIAADRMSFVFGREQRWNIFDSIVVIASLTEVILDCAGVTMDLGISVLRALRVVRIIRLLRVSKNIGILCNLKTMLYSLAGSATSFVAALILLAAVMYVFSLLFMQGVVGYLRAEHPSPPQIQKLSDYYGKLDLTLWTLLGAVTGGYDWAEIAEPLLDLGPLYTFFFLLYISFVLFGLLNILNGIFVNAALESSEMNRELQVNRMLSQRDHMVEDMVTIFLEADVDGSGTVSWTEFENYWHDERVKAYFMALELDMSSIMKIFDLLDSDTTGELGVVDFVEGCIRLRGSAKMVDIAFMQRDYESMLDRFEANFVRFEQYLRPERVDSIEQCVKAIAKALPSNV